VIAKSLSSLLRFGLLLLATVFFVHTGTTGIKMARAQSKSGSEVDSYESSDSSAFEMIFNQHYPDISCKDAPSVLSGQGITCRYSIIELPTRDDGKIQISGGKRTPRSPTRLIRVLPTITDAREILALTGLDMMDIMEYGALSAVGDRDRLIAILTRLIEPKMDKHNKMALEGYDPRLCVNATGDHIYHLDIPSDKMEDIKGSVKLFHAGRYAEYRERLEEHLSEYPNLSYLYVGIGNAYFAEGDLVQAQQQYRKGASANPMNPMLGYSMAFCHLANGDASKAIEALTGSVMTCRNNMLAWLALDCLLSGQGGGVVDRRFRNRTYVAVDLARIWVDKGVPPRLLEPWLYYAAAEIATEHQRSGIWNGFEAWDLEAIEFYKVAHLLGMYIIQKHKNDAIYDPYLETLESIYEAGYLRQYVLFDKIAPYAQYQRISTMPMAEKQKMRQYIDRFVIRQ